MARGSVKNRAFRADACLRWCTLLLFLFFPLRHLPLLTQIKAMFVKRVPLSLSSFVASL